MRRSTPGASNRVAIDSSTGWKEASTSRVVVPTMPGSARTDGDVLSAGESFEPSEGPSLVEQPESTNPVAATVAATAKNELRIVTLFLLQHGGAGGHRRGPPIPHGEQSGSP